jgi:hypothetical protein
MPVNNLIQLRKGTFAEWGSQNPILSSGEPGFDISTNILKIGDGINSWNNLQPINYNLNNYNILGTGNINIIGNISGTSGVFDQIVFNTSLDDPNLLQGQLQWNATEGTLDLGVNQSYAMHLGEEMLYRVRNTTGLTLLAGQPVYATGVSPGANNRIEVGLYVADGSIREVRFMGLVTEDITDNGNSGYATHFGYIRKIDTRGDAATNGTTNKLWTTGEPEWYKGDVLYVHPTVAGKLTKIEPQHSISVAIITSKGTNGKIFVRPTSYGHLSDNHDVSISGVTNGQFLQYNSSSGLWLASSTGNFTSLYVNGTGVSISGHIHSSSDISNFNSAVNNLVSGIYAPLTGTLNQFANTTSAQLSSIISDETGSGLLVFNNSPTFTGIPLVPTATSGTNTNQIASTSFVRTEISNLVNSAPSTLDTLNELAAALGNDASFSTTITNSLASKANLSGATFTGSIIAPSGNFTQSLQVNGTGVSLSGHVHTTSQITNFNSGVSGLLPVVSITGTSGILVSSSNGAYTIYSAPSVTGYEILTSAKSTFTVTQGYIANNLNVFLNGVKLLRGFDYTASNGSTFNLTESAISGDLVEWQGVGGSAQYSELGHTHTSSNITDFNSSVSGLFNKRIDFFTASDNQPPSSGFATLDTRNSIAVLEFDASSNESAVFMGSVPSNAVLVSGLATKLWWMADTATSGSVVWSVQFEAQGTDNDSDSFDIANSGTSTTNGTSGIETETEITCTTIDNLSNNNRYRLKINRVANSASDTMTGDAQLIAVEVRSI